MSVRAKSLQAPRLAAALLTCTILAGVPGVAWAQDGGAPAPAPSPSPAPASAAAAPDAAAAPAAPASAPQSDIIRSIAVAGAQRLEPETIVSYVQLRPGQRYTAAAGDQALKDLAATELFSDQRIDFRDGTVVITVKENPVVNRIVLEGNKRIKDEKITPEIKLAPRQIFTRSKVRADVNRIIELYKRQGRFAATVEPKMIQLDQNRVDVVFEINEGARSRVRQINIVGNQAFSAGELRGQMVTKVAGPTKIFSQATTYDPDRLAFDQQKLRQFYLTKGYADFRVVSAVAELTPDKRDFIITYVVEEGKRYKFGDVAVESQIRDFDSSRLTAQLPMHKGDWFDAKQMQDTEDRLKETAGAFGYAFADVKAEPRRHPDTLTMDVKFVINDAPRVYVERIDVNGNTLTQDKVIRREFRTAEGDAFNSLQVKRTTNRINSLGYFQENFKVDQTEGSAPDRIVLEANVQEQATGELSLSAGYSSLESWIFQGSIKQKNFRGRGQIIGLSVDYSAYSKSGQISFSEPYVFDKNISFGMDIYHRQYNNGYLNQVSATYDQATTGTSLRVGVPLTEFMSLLGRYTFNFDDITIDKNTYFADLAGTGTPVCEPLLAGRYLCDALGKRTTSLVGVSLIYRSLDSSLHPTRGTDAALNLDFAGVGGDTHYARVTANYAHFWPLGRGFIFSLTGQAGYIEGLKDLGPGKDNVLLTDRLFLGEPDIRGFDIRGVGPRVVRQFYDTNGALLPESDKSTVQDAIGGHAMYLGRAELEIPLGSGAREMGFRPSIFLDVGSVFSVKHPTLSDQCTYPNGCFFASKDASGNPLYIKTDTAADGTVTTNYVTNAKDPSGNANTPLGTTIPPFKETFYGDSPSPRVSIGIGVNWNSPFGPFRINLAYPLVHQKGDDTKRFSFNVGTQF